MKCCSRSTLGVIIGILSILLYVSVFILTITSYHQIEVEGASDKKTYLIILMVVCPIMAAISCLLVLGIVKRRHLLMCPWLILSVFGFFLNCGQKVLEFIANIVDDVAVGTLILNLLLSLLILGIEFAIIFAIYTLCRDISRKNVEQPAQSLGNVQYSGVPTNAPQLITYNYQRPSCPEQKS